MAEEEIEEIEEVDNDNNDNNEKGTRNKKLIWIMSSVTILVLIAGGSLFFLRDKLAPTPEELLKGLGNVDEVVGKNLFFYKLPPIVVNLSDGKNTKMNNTGNTNKDGKEKVSYLRLVISLEVRGGTVDFENVKNKTPRIMSAFNTYAKQFRPEDFRSSSGLYHLKEGFIRRANMAVTPIRIEDVLFEQIIMQ